MKYVFTFAMASALAVASLGSAVAQTAPTPQVNPATRQGDQAAPPGGTATTAPSDAASSSTATDNTSMMGPEPMSTPCPQGATSPSATNNATGTPEGCKKM